MKHILFYPSVVILFMFLPLSLSAKDEFAEDVQDAIAVLKKKDPEISKLFSEAIGYAVYPNVGKAGFFVGGAHGDGLVYEKGKLVGKSTLAQASFGLQFGGQEFSEIVFFETEAALRDFKKGKFSVSAQVSAVAAAEGAAKKAKFIHGVLVFLSPKSGVMVEAAVGGQKLSFESL